MIWMRRFGSLRSEGQREILILHATVTTREGYGSSMGIRLQDC